MRPLPLCLLALACSSDVEGDSYRFLVYEDNGLVGVDNDPVSGATVYIAAEGEVRTEETDSEGIVEFDGLRQPFSVTAAVSAGGTLATTLQIDNTSAVYFGIPLITEEDEEFEETASASPNTVLEGTVTNIPAIPDGWDLVLNAKVSNEGETDRVLLSGPQAAPTASLAFSEGNFPAGPSAVWVGLMRDNDGPNNTGRDFMSIAYRPERLSVVDATNNAVGTLDFDGEHAFELEEVSINLIGLEDDPEIAYFDIIIDSLDVPIGIWGPKDFSDWTPPATLYGPTTDAPDGVYLDFFTDSDEWFQEARTTRSGNQVTLRLLEPTPILNPSGGDLIDLEDLPGTTIEISPGQEEVSGRFIYMVTENDLWAFPVLHNTDTVEFPPMADELMSRGEAVVGVYAYLGDEPSLSLEQIGSTDNDGLLETYALGNLAESEQLVGIEIR